MTTVTNPVKGKLYRVDLGVGTLSKHVWNTPDNDMKDDIVGNVKNDAIGVFLEYQYDSIHDISAFKLLVNDSIGWVFGCTLMEIENDSFTDPR